jgi:Sec-independent protein translocase protein TatA
MQLLNELMARDLIDDLICEIDEAMASYNKLVEFTQLNEGSVDSLDDKSIQKVVDLRSQMRTVMRARNWLKDMKGPHTPLTTKQRGAARRKLTMHEKKIRAAIKEFKTAIDGLDDELRSQVMGEIKQRDRAQHDEEKARTASRTVNSEPETGVDDNLVPKKAPKNQEVLEPEVSDLPKQPELAPITRALIDPTPDETDDVKPDVTDLEPEDLPDDVGSDADYELAALIDTAGEKRAFAMMVSAEKGNLNPESIDYDGPRGEIFDVLQGSELVDPTGTITSKGHDAMAEYRARRSAPSDGSQALGKDEQNRLAALAAEPVGDIEDDDVRVA